MDHACTQWKIILEQKKSFIFGPSVIIILDTQMYFLCALCWSSWSELKVFWKVTPEFKRVFLYAPLSRYQTKTRMRTECGKAACVQNPGTYTHYIVQGKDVIWMSLLNKSSLLFPPFVTNIIIIITIMILAATSLLLQLPTKLPLFPVRETKIDSDSI